jgi:FkbM family methyltransferase
MVFSKIAHLWNRWRYQRDVPQLIPRKGGTGACGQDVYVAEILGGKRGGVFVDIGASDGVSISNTCYLERDLGWSGLAVEPIPSVFARLSQARRCQLLNACITDRSGKSRFTEVVDGVDMYSGLSEKMDPRHRRRIRRTIKRQRRGDVREIEVDCVTWHDALARHGIREVDFLSLDTEGGELDILRSIDFARTPVKVISVENNYFTHAYTELLSKHGFERLGAFKVDEIHVWRG